MSFAELISQLLGWLGEFVQFVFSFVPRIVIVRGNQLGVRQVKGRDATRIDRGVSWFWPWCTEVTLLWVARQCLLVPPITVETSDGQRMAIGCAITYRITDPIRYHVENFDADSNMGEVAMAGLREIVTTHTAQELSANTKEDSRFGAKLARRMGADLESFGVEVLSCRPTDQVRLDHAVRLFGMFPAVHS